MVARRPPSDSVAASTAEELRKSLAERQAEVDELRLRLAELTAAGAEFLSAAAHAIRSPLTVIHSYLEILATDMRDGLTEDQLSFLSIAHDNAVKLRRLVDDLVDLAALETGTAQEDPEPIPAGDLLTAVAPELARIAEAKGLELTVEVADDLPTVVVDRRRLEDVLRRLLDNAVRFTPAGGTVSLRAQTADGQLAIEVRDNGVGMPGDRVSDAVKPFIQLHRSPGENREGYGLGLALCRRTVEAFGGKLDLASAEGEGATVTITLPTTPQ